VAADVLQKLCADFQNATLAGDYDTALTLLDKLMPLHIAIFKEPGVAGAKYAMSRLGLCNAEVRLPLTSISSATEALLDDALRHAGLLN